jgi:hypothetical protein
MTLQKQLENLYREALVDTQWVEAELNDPRDSITVAGNDSGFRKEMKRERIKKTHTIFFAIVTVTALFAVSFIMSLQHAAAVEVHHKLAVHHKDHTASKDPSVSSNVHKVIAVIPEAHNNPDKVLANATAMKALTKGPYGDSIVIGGMTADGY